MSCYLKEIYFNEFSKSNFKANKIKTPGIIISPNPIKEYYVPKGNSNLIGPLIVEATVIIILDP